MGRGERAADQVTGMGVGGAGGLAEQTAWRVKGGRGVAGGCMAVPLLTYSPSTRFGPCTPVKYVKASSPRADSCGPRLCRKNTALHVGQEMCGGRGSVRLATDEIGTFLLVPVMS